MSAGNPHERAPVKTGKAGRARGCLCALGVWLLFASHAAAHGFPTPFRLLLERDDPDRVAVLLRPGIAFTESAGEAWSFVCGTIAGIAGPDSYPAALTGGHLLIGGYVGLYRDDGHGCGWSRVPAAQLPEGRIVSLYAGTQSDSVEALIAPTQGAAARFVSVDHGVTWTPLPATLPALDPRALRQATGDAQRLYLLGRPSASNAEVVWTSRDGGDHWTEGAQLASGCDAILGVDPTAPDRLFVGCSAASASELDAGVADALDRILVSADAAATFAVFAELPEIGGFALAPDGASAWVGSRSGGLWRADAAGSLQLLDADLHVGCVQYERDTLWVCARDERGYDAYALATSADGGRTLTPYLRSVEVSRLQTCGNPLQARTCGDEWNQWLYDVEQAQNAMDAVDAIDAKDATASMDEADPAARITGAAGDEGAGQTPIGAAASSTDMTTALASAGGVAPPFARLQARADAQQPAARAASGCAAQLGQRADVSSALWLLGGLACWRRRRSMSV